MLTNIISKTVKFAVKSSDSVINGANHVKHSAPQLGVKALAKAEQAKREFKFAVMKGIDEARR
jgi:hypothetical protein